MKIAVIGAGGVGGYFGARLAAAGNDVTFVQRGPHLEAMRAGGLRVVSPLGDVELATVTATDDTADIGPVDVVLVTVKSGHTDQAADSIKALLGSETAVITLQNGIENEDRLVAVLGRGHVMGGTAYILSLIEAPGVIRHSGQNARIIFGELDGALSPRARAFHEVCRAAGIDAHLSADIGTELWVKFVFLCPHNGLTALTRLPIGRVRDDPECREILRQATQELLALAAARGIDLPAALRDDPMARYDALPRDMTSSMHYDITHGKPLELEWLNGAVVRMGRENGVATPVNQVIYAALRPWVDGAVDG